MKKENLAPKNPYQKPDKTMKILHDIAVLEPGKKAEIAPKKISQQYKKIRDAKRFKILGEIPETIETKNGNKIEVVIPPSKISSQKAAKKIKEKYD